MSVLLILIPPRPRDGALVPPTDWVWAVSYDGRTIAEQGRSGPTGWPRTQQTVAVLDDADVAWHRVTLPKAPTAKLPQALLGVLEDHLLDDDGDLHFALPTSAPAGQPTWVAVVHRGWLAAQLAALEVAGRTVDRVLPSSAPTADPTGHFALLRGDGDGIADLRLAWADETGVSVLPLDGTLARQRLAGQAHEPVRWTASPAAASAAQTWLGHRVTALPDAERALAALESPTMRAWNLRQFALAPRRRGARALRDAARAVFGPAWRPARWGLAALVAAHVLGLNAWAWHERSALEAKRQAMTELLQQTHPHVRTVLDAPAQMAREAERLRTAGGRSGEGDLETLLGAVAAAWPPGEPPAAGLRFEPGRLTLTVPGWDAARVRPLRERLEGAGFGVELADGRVVVSRAGAAR